MKLHKTGRLVRIVSLVLVVAMLMTVCMTEAFAVVQIQPAYGTWQGYSLYGTMSSPSGSALYCDVTYGTNALINIDVVALYHNEFIDATHPVYANGTYNGYEARMVVTHDPNYPAYILLYYAYGTIVLTRDGVTSNPFNCHIQMF